MPLDYESKKLSDFQNFLEMTVEQIGQTFG